MTTVRIKSMEGSVVGERYRAIKCLKTGAVKNTYSCRDIKETQGRLVLKIIHTPQSFRETLRAWSRDFSLLQRLRSSRFARIWDFGKIENSGALYFVEERIGGKDFYYGTEGLSIEKILFLLEGLYRTVRYLHRRRIVHGALRPSNIFLRNMPLEALPLTMTDYGMADLYRGSDLASGAFTGMLPYSAPELLLGESPNVGSDLYSLGVLTYLVLTRRLPFEDADPGFLKQRHLQGSVDLRPIAHMEGGSGLVGLLTGLLEKDPVKRFASLDEAIVLIRGAMKNMPNALSLPEESENLFSTTRIVGREKELAYLRACADGVKESGRGWTVFVSGEAGSGKTRCLEELKCWGRLEGWRIIEGACNTQEEGSYSPYRRILAGVRPGLEEEIFHSDKSRQSEEPGIVKPSIDYAAGRFRDRLTRNLMRLLSERPTLLLLDDFHEADEATSTVLDYLSSDIQAYPVLMCVGMRSGEESGRTLDRVMERTVRQNRGEVRVLDPLPGESVEEFVALMTGTPPLKNTLGSWMFRHMGGNPFYLEEMLKHLVEQEILRYSSGEWIFIPEKQGRPEIPDSVGTVIRNRLKQLPPDSREVAGWLALINRSISTKLLSSISSLEISDVSRALKDLADRRMVRTEMKDSEEVAEFRHALIAEVARSCITKRKRQKMHGRIAEVFETEYGAHRHLQELARHSMEGKLGAKAVRYALLLADNARSEFSHEIALQCFKFALRDRSGLNKNELCGISIEAADTMLALGLPKHAIRLLKKEIAGNRDIDNDLKGRMFMQLALSCQHLGDFVGQEAYCKKGLRYFRNPAHSGKNVTKAMLYTELAFGAAIQSQPRRGLVFLKKAMESCPSNGADELRGRIQIFTAANYRVGCELKSSLLAAKKAEKILATSNESYLTCSALSTLGTMLMNLGRFPVALEKHRRAVQISEESRSVIPRVQAFGNLAECLCRMGRTQEALNALEGVLKTLGESDNPAVHHAFNTILAEVKIAENDYCSAYHIINQVGGKIRNSLAVYAVGHAHYITAFLYYILGDFEAAVESVELLHRVETAEAPCYESELADALHARISYEQGAGQKAVKRLRSLDGIVTRKRWPYQMAIIRLHLSEIFMKQGNLDEAGMYARNALRLAGAMQSVPLMSHSHLLLGTLYSIKLNNGDRSPQTGLSGLWINRKPFSHDDAVKELRTAFRLIEGSGHGEIAWRAHAELCRVFGRLHDTVQQRHHAGAAYDCLCKLESRTPSKMLPYFWNAFNRNRAKSELAGLLGSAKDNGSGSDIVVSNVNDEDQSRILFRVSTAVNSIRDLDPLLEAILDELIQATGMERALVFLKEGSLGKWKAAKGRNRQKECVTTEVTVSPSMLEEVGMRGNPVLSANVSEDPRFKGKILTIPGDPGRLLCAPLKVNGRVLGLLYADHSAPIDTLNESVINLFAAFCNLSAIAIDNSIAQQQLIKEKNDLERYLHEVREEYAEIVGKSLAAEALRDRIAVVAASPLDVLITGESGTGKELVARAIHRTCRRGSGKFLPVDCGSLSDTLAEAELFGYRKGAFTGALEDRPGLLEAAHGGILFLDEISNLPFRTQAKFLRVLEEREVRRVGETSTRKIDVQVVAATNRDLLKEIGEGRFREDLYYRLKKMEVRVPPLRERLEDIPLLAKSFLRKTSENEGGRLKSFSPEAMALLKRYPYPGNVRELLNVVAGSYYSSNEHTINVGDLPPEVRRDVSEAESTESGTAARLYREILDGKGNFEDRIKDPFLRHDFGSSVVRGVLRRALKESGGRYREAFRRLGIPDRRYATTMQFLKRHRCYLDFRLYRGKQSGGAEP